jgi:hypothetical protein
VCGAPLAALTESDAREARDAGVIEAEEVSEEEALADLERLLELDEKALEPVPMPVPEAPAKTVLRKVAAEPPAVDARRPVGRLRKKAARPKRATARRTGEPRAGARALTTWREFAAIATALALPAAAVASLAGAAGHEWGQLFLFGVLFGIGLSLTLPDARPVLRSTSFLVWVAGTVALAAVPLAALSGSPMAEPVAVAVLVVGTALAVVAVRTFPREIAPFLPWLSGLLLLLLASVAPLAFTTLGDPLAANGVVAVGGALAIGPAILVAIRREMGYLASRRLVEAEDALTKREYSKALGLYDETLALARRAGRDLDAALYGKGAALVATGRLDEALDVLDRALVVNPRNEIAWVNKGTALTRLGRMQDALRCYNSAIKVNAEYEVAWNNKGNALSRLGRHEWALQCYERAITLDPRYRTAWVNRGFVLAKLGRFEEAAECADQALRLTAGAAA